MPAPTNRLLLSIIALSLAVLALRSISQPAAHASTYLADDDGHTIAVCAMPSLINELMASDRFRPDLENTRPDLREQLDELRSEAQELNERFAEDFDPQNPDDQAAAQRMREINLEIGSLNRQLAAAVSRTTAEQLKACYQLVRSSADAIAEDLGYDYVIATGDFEEDLASDPDTVLRQITARPVLRFPGSVDITDDVRDDLNLE